MLLRGVFPVQEREIILPAILAIHTRLVPEETNGRNAWMMFAVPRRSMDRICDVVVLPPGATPAVWIIASRVPRDEAV